MVDKDRKGFITRIDIKKLLEVIDFFSTWLDSSHRSARKMDNVDSYPMCTYPPCLVLRKYALKLLSQTYTVENVVSVLSLFLITLLQF